jgi:hypothetical protein
LMLGICERFRLRLEIDTSASPIPLFLDFDCISIKLYFGSESVVRIGNTIERLDIGCFFECQTISTVIFESGSTLLSIGESVFQYCSSLSSIFIPSSVKMLDKSCFYGCESLSIVTFESGSQLSSIAKFAFRCCSSLSSICCPSSVKRLGNECFCKYKSLSTVTFESDSQLLSLAESAFQYCSSLSSFCIPPCLQELGKGAFEVRNLREISVAAGNRHFRVSGSFLLDFECISMMLYFGSESAVKIENTIKRLDIGCFLECRTTGWSISPCGRDDFREYARFLESLFLVREGTPH